MLGIVEAPTQEAFPHFGCQLQLRHEVLLDQHAIAKSVVSLTPACDCRRPRP